MQADTDLGDIPLIIKKYTMKEVTVTSQRRMLSQKAGKLVYLVQNSPFAQGFSTRDLLIYPSHRPDKRGDKDNRQEQCSCIGGRTQG